MTLSARCAAISASLVLAIGSWTAPAFSQASVPFDVTAQTISSTAVIDSYVDTHAKELATGDRDKIVAARQALMLPGTPNKKSAEFLKVYSKAITAKLMPIASGIDPHAKLNAAMVVGKVAEMGGTAELIPLLVKLIGDDSPAVSLYGIRGASSLIPVVLGDKSLATKDAIVPAISEAIKKHSTSEAIVAESYLSLVRVLGTPAQANLLAPNVVTTATPRVIDGLLLLLEDRSSRYGSGELVEPLAELPALVFLTKQSSWAAMNEATQARAVEVMLAIANGAAKELDIEFNRKPSSRPRLQALQKVMKDALGQGFSVIGTFASDAALTAEADKLKPLNTLTPPAQWQVTIGGITDAFSKAFKIQGPASQPAK